MKGSKNPVGHCDLLMLRHLVHFFCHYKPGAPFNLGKTLAKILMKVQFEKEMCKNYGFLQVS